MFIGQGMLKSTAKWNTLPDTDLLPAPSRTWSFLASFQINLYHLEIIFNVSIDQIKWTRQIVNIKTFHWPDKDFDFKGCFRIYIYYLS